jgi:hypothetical protein
MACFRKVDGCNPSTKPLDTKRQEMRSATRIPNTASQPLPSATFPAAKELSLGVVSMVDFISEPLRLPDMLKLRETDRKGEKPSPPLTKQSQIVTASGSRPVYGALTYAGPVR